MWHITLKKSCVAQHGDLFDKVFYIDIYRACFICCYCCCYCYFMLLLDIVITDSLKPLLTKRSSEVSYWKLNEMPGRSDYLRQKHQFLNFWGKAIWGNYGKRVKSKWKRRVSNRWNHIRRRGVAANGWESQTLNFET